MYKNDFLSSVLDNYLHLSQMLSINKKQLLVQKYAPMDSVISFPYSLFIDDLFRQQQEHPRSIRLFLT